MEKSSNPENKRVARIKIILDREHITQKDLADRLVDPHDPKKSMEPQNLSRMMKTGKITEKTCRRIVAAFPEYRLDWLMGYDDIMTVSEFQRLYVDQHDAVNAAVMTILDAAVKEVCLREGMPTPKIDDIPGYLLLSAQLRDYADSLIWNYLKHREHSHVWTLLDQQ